MNSVRSAVGMQLSYYRRDNIEAVTSLDPLVNQRFQKSALYRHIRALAVRFNEISEYAIQRSHAAISIMV
jgi:hypothetical protein